MFIAHSLVKLSAHFCRLLLVTVHTIKSLDCTITSSCEHMSICQHISHCLCCVVVNTTAFIWESPFTCELISANCCLAQSADISLWAVRWVPAFRLIQLLAHLCRSLLVTVHTIKPQDCTSTSSCGHVWNWQFVSHCFCLAPVNTGAFIGDISMEYAAAVSSSLPNVAWNKPQKWLPGLLIKFHHQEFSSFLRSVACHSLHKWVAGLYKILDLFCYSQPYNIGDIGRSQHYNIH